MRRLKTVYEVYYLTQKTSIFITAKCLGMATTVCIALQPNGSSVSVRIN